MFIKSEDGTQIVNLDQVSAISKEPIASGFGLIFNTSSKEVKWVYDSEEARDHAFSIININTGAFDTKDHSKR